MSMIGATSEKNESNATEEVQQNITITNPNFKINIVPADLDKPKVDQSLPLIKTETRAGYVNIDGTERENVTNETLADKIKQEKIKNFMSLKTRTPRPKEPETRNNMPEQPNDKHAEVDDIIVLEKRESERLQPPSNSKAKDAFKMLPTVLQDFLNNDWKSKPKCEPQRMLERIRKEKRYPDHPDVNKYEMLLTPAPSFLQRISLAGEFLTKKPLEM